MLSLSYLTDGCVVVPPRDHPGAGNVRLAFPAALSSGDPLLSPEMARDVGSAWRVHSPRAGDGRLCARLPLSAASAAGLRYICTPNLTSLTAAPCSLAGIRRSDRSCGLVVQRNSAPSV